MAGAKSKNKYCSTCLASPFRLEKLYVKHFFVYMKNCTFTHNLHKKKDVLMFVYVFFIASYYRALISIFKTHYPFSHSGSALFKTQK